MRFSFLSSPLPSPPSFLSQAARGSGGILTLKSSGTAAVGSSSKRRDQDIAFPKFVGDETCRIVGIARVGIRGSRSAEIVTGIRLHRRGGQPCRLSYVLWNIPSKEHDRRDLIGEADEPREPRRRQLRRLMTDWAAYCARPPTVKGNVVPLRA
jgi:hypothetical protein